MENVPKRRKQVFGKEKNISKDEFMAASIGDSEWLDQSLRDGHNPNCFDKHGQAPIHLAAMHGRLNCLELLVEKYRVDVDSPAAYAWSPLHFAINKNSGKNAYLCLSYLLKKGGDVNCRNDDNVTLLHQAANEGLLDCIKLLLKYGASTDVTDVRGQTPYDVARLWGHRECARILKAKGWKNNKKSTALESKILNELKEKYIALQKDAVHMLRNEQEFYGNVTYGNWMENKHLAPDPGYIPAQIEKNADDRIKGLTARLFASGAIKDCAIRSEIQSSKTPTTKPVVKAAKQGESPISPSEFKARVRKIPYVRFEKSPLEFYLDREEKKKKAIEMKTQRKYWNCSTNINTPRVTNIKSIHTIGRSIKPDEDPFPLLPPLENLSVKLENKPHLPLAIKVTLPGGSIENAPVSIPNLPREVIYKAICGKNDERIKIPQEFKCVHIFDVKRKRQLFLTTSSKPNEVEMHLKMYLDDAVTSKTPSTA